MVDQVGKLLNPLATGSGILRNVLGNRASQLAIIRRLSGGRVRQEELVVSYAYYGAARGRWMERQPQEEEDVMAAWGTDTGDLFINDEILFAKVPERIWRYELGGYPVLKKWLGYRDTRRRSGRALSLEEVR